MTKPLANPTPLAQRGQGRKRSKITLHSGSVTFMETDATGQPVAAGRVTLSAPVGALICLTYPNGNRLVLYPD